MEALANWLLWLQRYRWQLLAVLIALAVILRVVRVPEYALALFVIVVLGIALFAPSPKSPGRR